MAKNREDQRRGKLLGIPLRLGPLLAVFATGAAALFLLAGSAQAQTVTATLPTGAAPLSVAVNPVTNKMYVANRNSNNVTIIDGATNTTTTVPLGASPGSIAVNTVTNKVYVTTSSGGGSVTIIDGAADAVITTVTPGISPGSVLANGPVAVNPVTNKIYAVLGFANMTVIDGATNTATNVSLGDTASGVAVNPVTNKIYVTFGVSPGAVRVFDGTNNAVLKTLCCFSSPQAVAVNPVTNKVYVTSTGFGELTVIDGATDTAITTLTVGTLPLSLAVNPVTNKIYVANQLSNTVAVMDGATDAVAAVVTAGTGPRSVAVNPTTNQVYVANQSINNVTIIDGATNATTTLAAGSGPFAVGVNPLTNKVYVTNAGSNDVTVIDGATYSTQTVTNGQSTFFVAVNPVTNKTYVSNSSGFTVTVIDGATNTTRAVLTGFGPQSIGVNPVTNKVYVANHFATTVTVIDGATNTTTTVAVGTNPGWLAVNPVTNKVYVPNSNSNTVTVIDGATNATTTIPVGNKPASAAVNTVTNRVYVTNQVSNTVTVIDGATNATITTVPVGNTPAYVAVNSVTNKVYVPSFNTPNVTVIDGATNAATTIALGLIPGYLDLNPLTNMIYITHPVNNTVTVIDGATNATTPIVGVPFPGYVAVNPVTNKIFATDGLNGNITVIDGATNAIAIVPATSATGFVAVNPVTNKVYMANEVGNDVTVLTEQQTQTIPLTTAIGPLPNNETNSPTPSFTFTVTSTFSPNTPAVNAVYFQLDTQQGEWTRAVPTGAPGTFTGTLPALSPGTHILYAFATDGQDASSIQIRGQSSPLVGQIAAYHFLSTVPQQSLSIDDVSVTKPNSGTTDAIFTVTLSGASTQNVTVDFTTADGTALSGPSADYQFNSGTLTFNPGETSKSITVLVNGNMLSEPDKTFFVNLSNAGNAAIADAQGVGTIISGNNFVADLDISASGSPDPIDTGEILQYVVNVTNSGLADATGVLMTYAMPSDALFDSVSSGGVGCTVPAVGSSGIVTCDFGTIAVSTTKAVSIMVKPQTAGTLFATFDVVANEPDPDPTNNSITVTTTVNLAPVVINVTETILVSDVPGVLPSAMIGVTENITVSDTPGLLLSAMITVAESIVVTDAPGVTANFNTPQGTNIFVTPVDPVTNTSPATLTFNSVIQAGNTTLTSSSSGPATPAGLAVGNPAVYYDLSTTAQFSGSVTVCINYAGITFPRRPRLFHFENGAWIDVTVSVDIVNQIVCGSVTSLSPFALFYEEEECHYITIVPSPSIARRGERITVNTTVRACASTPQRVAIKFTFTGPFRSNNCGTSSTIMFTTLPFMLAPNTFRSVSFPFRVPANACTGTFSITATTLVSGTPVDTSTASLTVTP